LVAHARLSFCRQAKKKKLNHYYKMM